MMKRYPNVFRLTTLHSLIEDGPRANIANANWVPARPMGLPSLRSRIKAAWLVFTGKADAVTWPGQ